MPYSLVRRYSIFGPLIPACSSRPGPSARFAHPCWPPPRPPRRALCSPGRIHPPQSSSPGRRHGQSAVRGMADAVRGLRGHRWGPRRCRRNALGRAPGQVAGARREARTALGFLLHDRTPARSGQTGGWAAKRCSVTLKPPDSCSETLRHQKRAPAPRPRPLVCAWGRGSRVFSQDWWAVLTGSAPPPASQLQRSQWETGFELLRWLIGRQPCQPEAEAPELSGGRRSMRRRKRGERVVPRRSVKRVLQSP